MNFTFVFKFLHDLYMFQIIRKKPNMAFTYKESKESSDSDSNTTVNYFFYWLGHIKSQINWKFGIYITLKKESHVSNYLIQIWHQFIKN